MELKLVVLAGAKEGLEIPLKKEKFLIGRAKDCALRAGSEAISRRHCAIVRAGDNWTVRDLGSRNGTHLNDVRIAEETPLKVGDELRVGPLKFRVAPIVTTSLNAGSVAAPTPSAKPRKQPPVKDVADVVQRTVHKASENGTTEDDISRWLLGVPDSASDTLKETRTIRLEETTLSRPHASADTATVEDASALLATATEETGDVQDAGAEQGEAQKGASWNIFKRGKSSPSKRKPGKLPPRPDAPTKDSREAAADILREMTRRR
jgi:pSer/pThr/pTyr-binding forkhead associated (FHA) protein